MHTEKQLAQSQHSTAAYECSSACLQDAAGDNQRLWRHCRGPVHWNLQPIELVYPLNKAGVPNYLTGPEVLDQVPRAGEHHVVVELDKPRQRDDVAGEAGNVEDVVHPEVLHDHGPKAANC